MADKKKKQAGRRAYLNDFHRDLTGAYIYDGSHFHFAGDGWKQALLRLWALGIVLVVLAVPTFFVISKFGLFRPVLRHHYDNKGRFGPRRPRERR